MKLTLWLLLMFFIKSVDGVLGIRTWGRRMVGADETTELWQPQGSHWCFSSNNKKYKTYRKSVRLESGQICI